MKRFTDTDDPQRTGFSHKHWITWISVIYVFHYLWPIHSIVGETYLAYAVNLSAGKWITEDCECLYKIFHPLDAISPGGTRWKAKNTTRASGLQSVHSLVVMDWTGGLTIDNENIGSVCFLGFGYILCGISNYLKHFLLLNLTVCILNVEHYII